MESILLVAAGGALGSVCRHLVGLATLRVFGPALPWGTLTVNIAGSFVMGVLAVLLASRPGSSEPLRLLLATGFLGGFTTFSAFSLDFARLAERGDFGLAAGYALASVVLSLLAVFAGLLAARSF